MSDRDEIRHLAQQLFFLAKGQSAQESEELVKVPFGQSSVRKPRELSISYRDDALADFAQALWTARLRRSESLDASFFGESAWDILLDLFVHHVRGKKVQVTSACIASNVAPTTALRWLEILIERGLVVRRQSEIDRRRVYVSLSPNGVETMRKALHDQIVAMRSIAPFLQDAHRA